MTVCYNQHAPVENRRLATPHRTFGLVGQWNRQPLYVVAYSLLVYYT